MKPNIYSLTGSSVSLSPRENGGHIHNTFCGVNFVDHPELARENIAKMGDYEAKLKELCVRIAPDLDNCSDQDKKDAYTYLDLKVTATPEGVDIKGYIQSKLLTTARTSA